MPRGCPSCFTSQVDEIKVLDFKHCNLLFVPEEIYEFEKSLEELYLDSNNIKDLPRPLFHCHNLRKLGASDNELCVLPPAIASLVNLEELDISKNGIMDLPDNIKCCKTLNMVELSVNPIGKLPDGFTQLLNLTHLYLNDTFLDYLPANFGRLVKLKILEIRENHLKSLPKSMARLKELERLDLGNNDFDELPEVVGTLVNLTELWVDSNTLSKIPSFIGNLKRLQYFDGSKNKIESLPPEVDGLESLTDMHLSTNCLKLLPESIGKLSKLSTLKVDDNQLSMLPYSIGGMISMEELILNMNDLQELPPSIGLLRNIRHLNVDDNLLFDLPSELGSCSHIRLLSLRGNKLEVLPDELGRISRLTVVNLSNNRLKYLPFNFCKLKNLQALWLSDNQSKPLIPLQTDWDEYYQNRILTCFMFPQQPRLPDDEIYFSDGESFHPSLWEEERRAKKQIMFDVNDSESETMKIKRSYKRSPTPFPKEPYKPRRLVLTQPNGDIPDGRRGHNKTPGYSAVETNRLGLGPDIRIGEAKVTKPSKPSSPLHDRHHLYNADKKKSAKDKARIRRGSRDSTGTESDTSPTRSLLSSSNSSPSRKPEMMIHSTSGRSINDDDSEDIMVAAKQPIVTAPPHRDSPSPDSGKGSPGERSPLTSTSPMDNSPIRTLPDGSPVRSLPDGSSTKSPTSPTTVLPAPSGSSDKITLPHESPKKIVSGIQSPVKQSSGNCSPARRIPPNGSVSSSPVKRATKTGSPVKVVHSQVHNKTNTLPSSMGSPTKTVSSSGTNTLPSYEQSITKKMDSPKKISEPVSQKIINTDRNGDPRLPERPQTLDIVNKNVNINENNKQHEKHVNNMNSDRNNRTNRENYGKNSRNTMERTPVPGWSDATSPDSPEVQMNCYAETYLKDKPLPNYPDRRLGGKQYPPPSYHATVDCKRGSPRNRTSGYSSDNRSGYGSDRERSPYPNKYPGYIERDRSGYFSDRERGYQSDRERSGYFSDMERAGFYGHRDRYGYNGDRERANHLKNGYHSDREGPSGYYSDRERYSGYQSDRDRPSGYSTDWERSMYRQTHSNRSSPTRNSPQFGPAHGNSIRNYGQILNRLDNVKIGSRSPQPPSPLTRRPGDNGGHSPQIPSYDQAMRTRQPGGNQSNNWRQQVMSHIDRKGADHSIRESPVGSPSRYEQAQAYKNDLRLRMMKQRQLLDVDDVPSDLGSDDVFTPSPYRTESPSSFSRSPQSQRRNIDGSPQMNSNRSMPPSPPTRSKQLRPQPGMVDPRLSPRQRSREPHNQPSVYEYVISKNPGLGFSIAGGIGSQGNPFRPNDPGIFVTKVQPEGPAAGLIYPGDKLLEVSGIDFRHVDHQQAVIVLKTNNPVKLVVSREEAA